MTGGSLILGTPQFEYLITILGLVTPRNFHSQGSTYSEVEVTLQTWPWNIVNGGFNGKSHPKIHRNWGSPLISPGYLPHSSRISYANRSHRIPMMATFRQNVAILQRDRCISALRSHVMSLHLHTRCAVRVYMPVSASRCRRVHPGYTGRHSRFTAPWSVELVNYSQIWSLTSENVSH